MDRTEILTYGVSGSKQAKSSQDLDSLIYGLRDRYELAHLAYHAPRAGRAFEGEDLLFATGSPEFCKRYIERGYVEVDPVVRAMRISGMPVDWDSVDRSSITARRHFSELESFSIGRRGMTIPCVNLDGETGILSFSANHAEEREWAAFRDQRAPDLTYVGMHFHAAAMRIAKGGSASQENVTLTRQGKRLLGLFAQGHTPTMIAHMTGLSIHTVRMHLDRVQERLGCKTKAEVISKAIDLGLISKRSRMLAGR